MIYSWKIWNLAHWKLPGAHLRVLERVLCGSWNTSHTKSVGRFWTHWLKILVGELERELRGLNALDAVAEDLSLVLWHPRQSSVIIIAHNSSSRWSGTLSLTLWVPTYTRTCIHTYIHDTRSQRERKCLNYSEKKYQKVVASWEKEAY